MLKQHVHTLPMLALATAGCIWGTGFAFGKIALSEVLVASMDLFFASRSRAPVCYLSFSLSSPLCPGVKWGWVFAASLLGVPVQHLVQFKGLSLTTVSHASLMVGTLPMLLAIAAVLFAGERLHFSAWLALPGSTSGAARIAMSSKKGSGVGQVNVRGDPLIVVSMFAAIAWILISKRLMRRHSPVIVTAFVF
jgi:drug/metabolite transporter (DMT)-like permease